MNAVITPGAEICDKGIFLLDPLAKVFARACQVTPGTDFPSLHLAASWQLPFHS